jgi:hypothetical protein
MNRYNQKPLIGLIGAWQMYDVRPVPPAAGETMEILWMKDTNRPEFPSRLYFI